MAITFKVDHKGYAVIQSASFFGDAQYKAAYTITKPVNGADVAVHQGFSDVPHPSDEAGQRLLPRRASTSTSTFPPSA